MTNGTDSTMDHVSPNDEESRPDSIYDDSRPDSISESISINN